MIAIKEADYKPLRKISNDNYKYGLKFDIANDVISDITDNIYNLENKLEGLQKIFKNSDIDISNNILDIIIELDRLFSSDKWNSIIDKIDSAE
jgi:hypothetical protein